MIRKRLTRVEGNLKLLSQPQFLTDRAHLFTRCRGYCAWHTHRVSARSDNFSYLPGLSTIFEKAWQEWKEGNLKLLSRPQFLTDRAHLFTSVSCLYRATQSASFWPVGQLWLFRRNPPALLNNRIFDEKYVGLNKLQMMPRPNTSNLIAVLNTQALTEKSSDKISLSQNPDKSGRKLVILTKAWQEWQELVILPKAWQEWQGLVILTKIWNLKLLSRPQFLTDLAHLFTSD